MFLADQRAESGRFFLLSKQHAESSGAAGFTPAVHSRLPSEGVDELRVYLASTSGTGPLRFRNVILVVLIVVIMVIVVLLRGTIVNRTYGTHKNQYISLF